MSEPAAPRGPWRTRLSNLRARARAGLPFALGIIAAFLAIAIYSALFPAPPPLTAREVSDTVAQTLASATPAPARSALVFQFIQPSLVLIQVAGVGEDDEGGLGTGVVINDRGDILTSLHVVDGASAITVTFADGTESPAQVIATQPEDDIAVLGAAQLPAQLVPATLGSPDSMHVGDEAYVVGHPLGLYASLSAGVISGFERSFKMPNSERQLQGLIQVDAAINPGNSGGPLLNRDGQVIGIVAGLVNPTEQNVFIGIGFAVPITTAGGAAGLPSY
jgi:S1-C subfamily serine protease